MQRREIILLPAIFFLQNNLPVQKIAICSRHENFFIKQAPGIIYSLQKQPHPDPDSGNEHPAAEVKQLAPKAYIIGVNSTERPKAETIR